MNGETFCPACGDYRVFKQETRTETYRIRGIDILAEVSVEVCPKCGESLFAEERDNGVLERVYSEYRARKGLLSPSEIREVREQYGLSQEAFATLLGMSPATVNRYEGGALQEVAQNQVILACRNWSVVAELLDRRGHLLTEKQLARARKAVDEKRLSQQCDAMDGTPCFSRVCPPGALTGFRKFSYPKYAAAVSWLCQNLGAINLTKLNKLLFYTDFLCFKAQSLSVTGSAYKRLKFGPVPENYGALGDRLELDGYVDIVEVQYSKKCAGQEFRLGPNAQSAVGELTPPEVAVLSVVAKQLGHLSATQISHRSHKEKAWLETEDKQLIPYALAKDLSLAFPA